MEFYEKPIRDPKILERAQITFDLCEAAEQIMRENIRRRDPELSAVQVEERFVEWLRRRTRDDSYGRLSDEWAAKFGSQQ